MKTRIPFNARRRFEHLVLVGDLSVGDQKDDAVAIGSCCTARRAAHGLVEGLGDLGAAARFQLRQELDGPETVAVGGRDELRESVAATPRGVSIRSSKAKTANRSDSFRVSIMRAIARRAATIFQPLMLPERSSTKTTSRGRESASSRAPVARLSVRRSPRHSRRRRGEARATSDGIAPEPEPEDEVAVEPLARLKHQSAHAPLLFPPDREQADVQVVGRAVDWSRSITSESRTGLGKPGKQDGRRDPRGVGHGFRIDGGAVTDRRAAQRNAGYVTGRDHQREAERDLAVAVRQDPHHRELDTRNVARHQVADAQREDPRPLLLGDRRPVSLAQGLE